MSLYSTKLDQLYRFIAGKNILSRNLCRFIKGIHKLGPILSLHRCRKILVWIFSIASSVTKILANKIESLYSIFFSKIVYLYRFKRYIYEYRCPTLVVGVSWCSICLLCYCWSCYCVILAGAVSLDVPFVAFATEGPAIAVILSAVVCPWGPCCG